MDGISVHTGYTANQIARHFGLEVRNGFGSPDYKGACLCHPDGTVIAVYNGWNQLVDDLPNQARIEKEHNNDVEN